jgi:hypothetical protein
MHQATKPLSPNPVNSASHLHNAQKQQHPQKNIKLLPITKSLSCPATNNPLCTQTNKMSLQPPISTENKLLQPPSQPNAKLPTSQPNATLPLSPPNATPANPKLPLTTDISNQPGILTPAYNKPRPVSSNNGKPQHKNLEGATSNTCHHCGKVYAFKSSLSKHLRKEHSDESHSESKGYVSCHQCQSR